MHPDMEILENAITKTMPRTARGCLLPVRPQEREPCTRMGRGASDLESPCTEQMGSTWDEETYLKPLQWGTTENCTFWLSPEGRTNRSTHFLCSEGRALSVQT